MNVFDDYYYTKEHEWVKFEASTAIIGISDFAQDALGDITFIELPSVGDKVGQFQQFTAVESVKAASDIYCPISGEITEVNEDLEEEPGLINNSCYEDGWIVKVELSDFDERSNLMTSDEYRIFLESIE